MGERYKCTLTGSDLKKAIDELNEPADDSERQRAIEDFRKEFESKHPNLKLRRRDDAFFLRFLRAKKFDQQRAIDQLRNYAEQPDVFPEAYEKIRNPGLLTETLSAGTVVPLTGKAKDGSSVVIFRPGLRETEVVADFAAVMFLTMEALLENEEVQVYGVTVVEDLAYVGMALVKQANPTLARKVLNLIQNCVPVRLKSLNLTNEPKVFDILYAIMYPLMSEKMKKRLMIHGTDFTRLYEVVGRDVLPPMFAGNGPELDSEGWSSKLLGEQTRL